MKLTEKKRQQIILASVEEFKDNGFSNTSMDSVALRAQVSKRTVYNHFASKDELFVGIIDYMFSLMAKTSPVDYEPSQPLKMQLESIARLKVDLYTSDEFIDLSRVLIPEALHNPAKMQQGLEQVSTIESDMQDWFAKVIQDGKLNIDDPAKACNQFMGLLKMDAYWPRLLKGAAVPDKAEIEEIVEQSVGMFLSYYRR